MVLDRAHRPPGWGAWGRGPRRTPRPPARLTSPLTKPLCLRPSKRDLGLAPTRCEPGPASPSAFLWPLHCPGQTRCARAGWTQRRHGWTGPRARTRGSRPPGRWSLWRDCQGLDSAPPRHGYGYCSQGRTRLVFAPTNKFVIGSDEGGRNGIVCEPELGELAREPPRQV